MKIKLCGLKTKEAIEVAVAKHVNFIGFVFHPSSPRYIEPEMAVELSKLIPATIDRVAVFSDNDLSIIKNINKILKPEYFQFHGRETPGFLEKICEIFPNVKIIKAFQISSSFDLRNIYKFQKCCDAYLFDSKIYNNNDNFAIGGGSGISFDWKILSNFRSRKPWFVSGGINISNFSEACRLSGARMIDVSSGIEEIRGVKSVDLIAKLMDKVNNVS